VYWIGKLVISIITEGIKSSWTCLWHFPFICLPAHYRILSNDEMIYEYNVSYFDLGQVNHKETKTQTNKRFCALPITKLRITVPSMKDSLLQDKLSFVIDKFAYQGKYNLLPWTHSMETISYKFINVFNWYKNLVNSNQSTQT
jgi:hypothetical protein